MTLSLNKHYNLGTLTDAQVDENWDDISGEVNSLLSRLPQNNFSATTDPTANDDVTEGYSRGSLWYNRTTPQLFLCINANSGSAVWIDYDAVSGDLGTAAFSDILGAVSQSGGVPTGALFQHISNANGEAYLYADGRLECFGVKTYQDSQSISIGASLYRGGHLTVDFPVDFVGDHPVITATLENDTTTFNCWVGDTRNTGANKTTIELYKTTSATEAAQFPINWKAVGRWY